MALLHVVINWPSIIIVPAKVSVLFSMSAIIIAI